MYKRGSLVQKLEPRFVLDSTVVINEIMYHPEPNEESLEWVELYNQLSLDKNIFRWRLDGGIDYQLAEERIVGGGQRFLNIRQTGIAVDDFQLALEQEEKITTLHACRNGRLHYTR